MLAVYRFSTVLFYFLTLFSFRYAEGQQYDKLQEFERLLEQSIKTKDYANASAQALALANRYWDIRALGNAADYIEKSLLYGKKAEATATLHQAYRLQGFIYTETKNYSKALDSYQKSVKLAKELKQPGLMGEAQLLVATSYANLNRHKRSIEPLEEALSLAQQQKDWQMQQECYALLGEYHAQLGNSAKAREYQNLYDNQQAKKQQEEQSTQQLQVLEQKIKHVVVEKNTVDSKLQQEARKRKQTEDSLLSTKNYLEKTETVLQEAKEIGEKRKLEIELLNKDKELADMRIVEQHARIELDAWIRNSILAGLLLAFGLVAITVKSYRKQLDANKKIEKQNKNISSSINYAKRIQEAMLPALELQQKLLPGSFVLFKPRDSVSGDFYWFSEVKNWYRPDVVFAVADCTGHGVPGAFMSLIGINALNGIITRGIAEPEQILDALDEEIRSSLQQETSGVRDGMDIALCIYRKEKNILEFSGAKSSLVYIQNNELFQIKGDVHSIGGLKGKKEFSYKKHTVVIDQHTTFYLFSDGYRDQFAEDNSGKFMTKRFNKLLLDIHKLPLEEQREILNKTFEDWKGKSHQTDDVLVMGLTLEPVDQ